MTTMTTVGFGDVVPESDTERVVAIVAMIAGTGFSSYVIGSVSSIISVGDGSQRLFHEKMDLIYAYMKHHNFPTDLRRKVARFFKSYFEAKGALNESILNEMDPYLRHEVGVFLTHTAVARHKLFVDLPKGMLLKLGAVLKPYTALEGQDIVSCSEDAVEMFILIKGEVVILANDEDETVINKLGSGSSFGETAAFDITSRRTATVRALTTCELFRLSMEDIAMAFRDVPAVYETMRLKVIEDLANQSFTYDIIGNLERQRDAGSSSASATLRLIDAAKQRKSKREAKERGKNTITNSVKGRMSQKKAKAAFDDDSKGALQRSLHRHQRAIPFKEFQKGEMQSTSSSSMSLGSLDRMGARRKSLELDELSSHAENLGRYSDEQLLLTNALDSGSFYSPNPSRRKMEPIVGSPSITTERTLSSTAVASTTSASPTASSRHDFSSQTPESSPGGDLRELAPTFRLPHVGEHRELPRGEGLDEQRFVFLDKKMDRSLLTMEQRITKTTRDLDSRMESLSVKMDTRMGEVLAALECMNRSARADDGNGKSRFDELREATHSSGF